MRLLRDKNDSAVDIVLANEVALLAGFSATDVLVLAAYITGSSGHLNLPWSPAPLVNWEYITEIGALFHFFTILALVPARPAFL